MKVALLIPGSDNDGDVAATCQKAGADYVIIEPYNDPSQAVEAAIAAKATHIIAYYHWKDRSIWSHNDKPYWGCDVAGYALRHGIEVLLVCNTTRASELSISMDRIYPVAPYGRAPEVEQFLKGEISYEQNLQALLKKTKKRLREEVRQLVRGLAFFRQKRNELREVSLPSRTIKQRQVLVSIKRLDTQRAKR